MELETDCVVLQECRKFLFQARAQRTGWQNAWRGAQSRIVLFGESHFKSVQSHANLALVLRRSGKVAEGLATLKSGGSS